MAKRISEPSGISVGDTLTVQSMKLKSELMPGTFVSSTVSARRNTAIVVAILGEVDFTKPDQKFDVDAAMRMMGWKRIEE